MSNAPEVIIEGKGLTKLFGSHEAVSSIDLTIKRGEVVALIGPSGSGKSTLLRCLNGMETIDSGVIKIEEKLFADRPGGEKDSVSQNGKREITEKVGMVFQHFNLFPHKTVLENIIEAPMVVKGVSRKEVTEYALELLEKVDLTDRKNYYPSKISGGQKQRVAIARALGMKPDIMLFDEPTSALDPELVGEVLKVMKDLAEEHMTMIVVTHEMQFAMDVASRIIFMDNGKFLEDSDSASFFKESDHPRIQSFIEKING